MKKCPYCAEQIQDEAIVCRYCGSDLVKTDKPSKSTSKILLPFIAGLVIASLVLLFDIATNPYTNLGNLIFHFIANAVIWTVIIGVIVWAWRYQVGRIILVGIVGIAIVVYLLMNSGDVAIPAILIPTPYKTNTPSQRTTPTSSLLEATDIQKPKVTVFSTIVPPYEPAIESKAKGSDAWNKRMTEVAGWREQGLEIVPKYTFPAVATPKILPSINANEIDDSYVGEYISIIGRVSATHPTEECAQLILLSGSEDIFQLRGYYTIFEDVYNWMCILASGEIQNDETSLYMVIDDTRLREWDECR